MLRDASFLFSQVESLAVRGTFLLALAALCTLPLRQSCAAARHLVWRLALLAALATPVLSASLPGWELPLPSAATRELVPDLYLNHPPGAVPILADPSPTTLAARVRALPGSALRLGRDSGQTPAAGALCAIYFAGLLACLARLLVGWLGVQLLLARARPVSDPHWTNLVQNLAHELGLSQRVRLLRTTGHHTPLCTGILQPAIVLPIDAPAWSAQLRRVILLHELAHIRRRDCLMQLVAQLACALHWFNPLCWLAARQMRTERELACDDLVLHNGTRPSEYAGHLLAMAGSGGLPGLMQVGVAMVGRGRLEKRITALLDRQRSHLPLPARSTIAAGLVALALLLPVAALRAQNKLGSLSAAAVGSVAQIPAADSAEPPALRDAVRSFLHTSGILKEADGPTPPIVELTINPKLQRIVEDELDFLVTKWQATGATALILAPASGDILALASRSTPPVGQGSAPTLAPEPELAVHHAFEPGSTMKVFTVATALELHTITKEQVFDCENGSWQTGHGVLHDASAHGALAVGQILAVSSNIGAQKIYRTFGREELSRSLGRFHFGERPPVQLPMASPGSLPPAGHWSEEQAASIASGQGLSASPLQVAAAFAALANRGIYKAPTLVRRVTSPAGAVLWQAPQSGERVVSEATADTVLRLLEGVVQSPMGTGQAARVPGYLVAGKTGTANQASAAGTYAQHYYGSFVGAIPARRPAVVVLIGVDGPREEYSGGTVAAPSFSRIAQKVMAHLAVATDGPG